MSPTLNNQDNVIISKLPYLFKKPSINDIVAFIYKNKVFIKRIRGFENNEYFLEGDNKSDSFDSKKFGTVSEGKILGKVIYKF